MEQVPFRPRQYRLVYCLAVSLATEVTSETVNLDLLNRIYKSRQVQWGEKVGKILNWAAVRVEYDRENPLADLAHKASIVEAKMKMPHVGHPVLRVLVRDKTCLLENTDDARAIHQEWKAGVTDLREFFNQEKRLKFELVPMALTVDFKSSTDIGEAMVANIMAERTLNDIRGFVSPDDAQQAKLLLQAGFMFMPDA